MKKKFIFLLCLLLITTLMVSCSSDKKENTQTDNTPQGSSSDDDFSEDLETALSALATPGWPEEKIPNEIPEYPFGEVKNSGDFGDNEYVILISPTNKEELGTYLSQLEDLGFTLSNDDGARIGTTAIRFQFNTKDTLQMIVSESGTSQWPKLPGDFLPSDKGTLYGEVYIPNLTDDDRASGNYFVANFSLVDLTEEDCYDFVKKQVDNGWEDSGRDMASKDIVIDGVNCRLMFQFVQYYDNTGDFLLEAWQQ